MGGRKPRAEAGEVECNQTGEGLADCGEASELYPIDNMPSMKNFKESEAIVKAMFLKD